MNKKSKGFTPILIVVILGVIGIVVYLVLKQQSPPISKSPTPYPSQDETTNWKTYRNEEYRFEIKYPNNWKIFTTDYGSDIIDPDSNYAFTIHVLSNFKDPKKFLENQKNNPNFTTITSNYIQIGNYNTLDQVQNNKYVTHTQHHLWMEQNNVIYEIVFLTDNERRTETVSQILSTFKLLEQ